MHELTWPILAGLGFAAVTVALMWPMRFADKRTALTAAALERFAIGVVVGVVHLPWAGWIVGAGLGLLLSAGSAVLTRAYKPILVMGTLGGAVIGGLLHGWR